MVAQDEVYKISQNMIKYGGSFVKALGEALQRADMYNQERIEKAFPEYWKKYKEMK